MSITLDQARQIADASLAKGRELGLKPLAAIRSFSWAGLDPARMGLGPVFASAAALDAARKEGEGLLARCERATADGVLTPPCGAALRPTARRGDDALAAPAPLRPFAGARRAQPRPDEEASFACGETLQSSRVR